MPTYLSIFGNLDYALTKDQTLRLSVGRYSSTNGNLGVGGFDEIERAPTRHDSTSYNLRVQEAGPIGRRFFINTPLRAQLERFGVAFGDRGAHRR